MIKKLDHTDPSTTEKIQNVFRRSYAVEAELLGATDFPPLKRSLKSFLESSNTFYGFMIDGKIAGAMEIDASTNSTHIQSLVVDPNYFRRGIGSALLKFVFKTYDTPSFTVETGLDNGPATALYLRFGFKEVRQYDTDHGIQKIRFERTASS